MSEPLNRDLEYLNGQIDALMALVLALAANTMGKDAFRTSALTRLTALEDALIGQPVRETRLLAVTHTKDWIKNVTD